MIRESEFGEKRRKPDTLLMLDFKELDREEQTKRCLSRIKYAEQHKNRPPTVLELGARCLHCLLPYSKPACKDVCQYHPGYLVRKTWTCCGKMADQAPPDHNDHVTTGCDKIRHIWRIRRFAKGDRQNKSLFKSRKQQKSKVVVDRFDCQDTPTK
ncbi:hypothetical protein ScPMuIL_001449 [Solemya velum]